MKARAPGKLLLSGAYAVLEGAPAVVCAVNRYAWAQGRADSAPAEVRAALADPPHVDTSALEQDGRKLGLGSSAAGLVAALALRAAEGGQDVTDARVRAELSAKARAAHAQVQGGGSGVDVAASVHGGVLRYRKSGDLQPAALPPAMQIVAFFSGQSARTSELRARVDALRERDRAGYQIVMGRLVDLAERAEAAIVQSNAAELVTALQRAGLALAALGAAADAPIVLSSFAELAAEAARCGAAFIPSGAGGGDVGVFVGTQEPPTSFVKKAEALAMKRLDLAVDREGVIALPES